MQFTSISFLLIFLPLVFLAFNAMKSAKPRVSLLLAASAAFYWFGDADSLILMVGLSWLTFYLAQKTQITLAVVINLLFLFTFKFSTDLISMENFSALLTPGLRQSIIAVGLPLGTSYVVFKHIGYLLDIQYKRTTPTDDFLSFSSFSLYFPQILAGPISSFVDTGQQMKELGQKILESHIFLGLFRLSLGISKVTLISNVLVDWLAMSQHSMAKVSGFLPAWIVLLALSMRLYFDFSGYSDMAIGVSYLFGIKLPENFNNPYISNNYRDFWERWHISLSMWFRLYFFSPVSRKLLTRAGRERRDLIQVASTILTMVLIGLWHGNSWTFLLWGLYHGILMSVDVGGRIHLPKALRGGERPIFLMSMILGWAVFFAPDFATLIRFFRQLFGFAGFGDITSLASFNTFMPSQQLIVLIISLLISLNGIGEPDLTQLTRSNKKVLIAVTAGILFFFGMTLLQTNIGFLYGQF